MPFPGRRVPILSFVAAILLTPCLFAEEEPTELLQARAQFQKETDFALRPMRDRYVSRLQTLKRSLATRGDVRAAVAVQDEIDLIVAIANEQAILAKMVGTWVGVFKDGPPRRFVFKADGTVDMMHENGSVFTTSRVVRTGKDFIITWEPIEELHRVSFTESGQMVMEHFSPKLSYPKGAPAYRVQLTRSAISK